MTRKGPSVGPVLIGAVVLGLLIWGLIARFDRDEQWQIDTPEAITETQPPAGQRQ